jgi:hypothetical protein
MNLVMPSVLAAMTVKGATCRVELLPLDGQRNQCNRDRIRNKWSAFLQSGLTKA